MTWLFGERGKPSAPLLGPQPGDAMGTREAYEAAGWPKDRLQTGQPPQTPGISRTDSPASTTQGVAEPFPGLAAKRAELISQEQHTGIFDTMRRTLRGLWDGLTKNPFWAGRRGNQRNSRPPRPFPRGGPGGFPPRG